MYESCFAILCVSSAIFALRYFNIRNGLRALFEFGCLCDEKKQAWTRPCPLLVSVSNNQRDISPDICIGRDQLNHFLPPGDEAQCCGCWSPGVNDHCKWKWSTALQRGARLCSTAKVKKRPSYQSSCVPIDKWNVQPERVSMCAWYV